MLQTSDRRKLYDFLANLFAYPDPDTLALLCREIVTAAALIPDGPRPPRLAREQLHSLQAAHAGLFGNYPARSCTPLYGSIYLEGESRLIGQSTQFAAEVYRAEGLALEQWEEPPDYLPIELEFLSFLVAQEDVSRRQGDLTQARESLKKQADFCRALFHSWVFEFCARVAASPNVHPLYRFASELLEHFCRLEEELFDGHD